MRVRAAHALPGRDHFFVPESSTTAEMSASSKERDTSELLDMLTDSMGKGSGVETRSITPWQRAMLLRILKSVIDQEDKIRDDDAVKSSLGPSNVKFVQTCGVLGRDVVACDASKGSCPPSEVMEAGVRAGAPWAMAAVRTKDNKLLRCAPESLVRAGIDVTTAKGRNEARNNVASMWAALRELETRWANADRRMKSMLNQRVADDAGREVKIGVVSDDGNSVSKFNVGQCESRTVDTCHIPKNADGSERCINSGTFAHLPKADDVLGDVDEKFKAKCIRRDTIPYKFREMLDEDVLAIRDGYVIKKASMNRDGTDFMRAPTYKRDASKSKPLNIVAL